jgi:dihydroorotase
MLIKNGLVFDGLGTEPSKNDVLIKNGIIVKIAQSIEVDQDVPCIDAQNQWVLPGLVDTHCHLREPGFEYKEDIESGTMAAAAGGFTSICCMPNTKPVADSTAVISQIIQIAKEKGHVKVYPTAAITKQSKGSELTEMAELSRAGAIAFTDDGLPVQNPNMMRLAMEYASGYDLLLMSHCEEMSLSKDGAMNEGYMSTMLGLQGIPAAAEEVMIARDILLAEGLGTRIHIAHISTKGSAEIIRNAKKRGVKVTCETMPHYFSATDAMVEGYDTNTKVNPPLRGESDRVAMIEAINDNTVDCIATDHAPHHVDEKNVEYNLASNGISGFETAFALGMTYLVDTKQVKAEHFVKKMTSEAANVLGINAGTIREGVPADITIADPNKAQVIDVNQFYSKGKNSPFNGQTLKGIVNYTLVDGKVVYHANR